MKAPAQGIAFITAAVALFAVTAWGAVSPAGSPRFVSEPPHGPNAAAVERIVPSLSADVVILAGGREQGLRRGMVCTVNRGAETVGELIVVEARGSRSAGLILDLAEDAFIQPGDVARIKTLQNS